MRHLNAQLRSWFRSSSFPKSRPVNAAGAPTPITPNHGKLFVVVEAFLIGLLTLDHTTRIEITIMWRNCILCDSLL